jgi:hypothetical protein
VEGVPPARDVVSEANHPMGAHPTGPDEAHPRGVEDLMGKRNRRKHAKDRLEARVRAYEAVLKTPGEAGRGFARPGSLKRG